MIAEVDLYMKSGVESNTEYASPGWYHIPRSDLISLEGAISLPDHVILELRSSPVIRLIPCETSHRICVRVIDSLRIASAQRQLLGGVPELRAQL